MDLSTEEFAFNIGVDPNTLNRIERGVNLPENNTMYKMSRFIIVQRLYYEHNKLTKGI
ncbi:helix-turn-helix domain-containing protein [Sutcliffiella cohnii]